MTLCLGPIQIVAQPAPCSTFLGRDVAFTVIITGGSPEARLRWQKNGVDLADTGRISGADSPMLRLDGVESGDAGLYRVRVWDDWMETNSVSVELKVITNVVFVDPNLEQAVRDGLGIPSAPLTPEDFMGITYLTVSYRDITNLSGLEAAADLEELDLGGNFALQSFEPLSFLSRLNNLHVYECRLDDLSFVALLPSLTVLEASRNFIEDLAALRRRPGLQYLDLAENELTDIAPLLDLAAPNAIDLPFNRLDTHETSAAWNVITNLQDRGVIVEYDPQRTAPVPPVITVQPVSVGAYPGDNINFHAEATGSGSGLNFCWQKDGFNLLDTPNRYGTDSDTLWIDNVQGGDAGSYRVRIWDENGVTHSRTVQLFVVTNVAFVDPQLEQAVRERLEIPTGPIPLTAIAGMDWLEAVNRGITNLSGLEAALNLDWLALGWNPKAFGWRGHKTGQALRMSRRAWDGWR